MWDKCFSDMNMKFTVLRNVKLCILIASTNVAGCRSICCLHLQDRRFVFCSTRTIEEHSPSLKMEATCSSEALMGALILNYNVLLSSRLIFNKINTWDLSVKWKYLYFAYYVKLFNNLLYTGSNKFLKMAVPYLHCYLLPTTQLGRPFWFLRQYCGNVGKYLPW